MITELPHFDHSECECVMVRADDEFIHTPGSCWSCDYKRKIRAYGI